MTRPWRLVLAVSAALFVTGFAAVQVSGYAHRPLVAEVAADAGQTHAQVAAEIGREISCGKLREGFRLDLNVWKSGIRSGHDAMVEANLEAMKAALQRLEWLENQGRCGG